MAPLNQLVGQRLMAGFVGTEINADLRYLIKALRIGGIILFRRNLDSPDQINRLCRDAQRYASECDLAPLFIAVDQEGGCVSRLPEPYSQFEGNPSIRNDEDAHRFADITGSELKDAGFNMNMAPVLDVAPTDCKSIMAERAFGADPEWVARMGGLVIEGLRKRRIIPVAKHFPGIGRTILDSHKDLPRLKTDYDSLAAFDLVPFQKAIEQQVDGIMLSHIIYDGLDPEWPASLSRNICSNLLRTRLGFGGVVITDDLDMAAIAENFDILTAIDRILVAEIDIALICHSMEKMEAAYGRMASMLTGSTALRESAATSYQRIMRLKKKYL